jgi:DNA-binding transcriptional LysR family regulator
MKLEALEDMIALYASRTLTEAAEKRNVSQPAFSRRIQALEEWLGVTLVDRSSKPAALTAVGRDQEPMIRSLVASIYELRTTSRLQAKAQTHLAIAAQHSLSPQPLLALFERHKRAAALNANYRLFTGDRQDCIAQLMSGEADVLYCYEKPEILHTVSSAIAKTTVVGHDQLIAVCSPQLVERLTTTGRKRPIVPILVYPRATFFGDLLWNTPLIGMMESYELETACLSSFSHGLLDLALLGHGVAWLPQRLIAGALAEKRLVPFVPAGKPVALNIVVVIARRRVEELTLVIRELGSTVLKQV